MEKDNQSCGSKSRPFERSSSYSRAIGTCSTRSAIEIRNIVNTEVYNNEDIKTKYRNSATYVDDGTTESLPLGDLNSVTINNADNENFYNDIEETSSDDAEDDQAVTGLVMKIDVESNESPNSSTSPSARHLSDASTRPVVSSSPPTEDLDSIEVEESIYNTIPETNVSSAHGYSTPYTKRKKIGHKQRRTQLGRPMRSRRVVCKDGEENVPVRSHIPSKSMKYMRDTVNTIINSKWRFIILLMVIAHFTLWLFFASIWYIVTLSYQDDIGDGKEHCVTGTSSFAGLLMMAVETQMTIGYGVRYPNEECPEAIVIMVIELVAGTALSGGLASLLFLKLVRPKRNHSSVGFSRKATVCMRDGFLCLTFRVWDLMNRHIISSEITAYILKPIRTLEGELVQNYIHQLILKDARSFLLWPITVTHVIDDASPLYDFSAQDMMDYRFEIVVCISGSSRKMGTVTQSRTSYLSKEIIWGYRFKNVVNYSKEHESFAIDMDNLNCTEQVDTPLCSASHLKNFEQDFKSSQEFLDLLPTDMSYVPEDMSTFSTAEGSAMSSPINSVTQRSLGWSFKKYSHVKDRSNGYQPRL